MNSSRTPQPPAMPHGSTAYDLGYDAGVRGLSPDLTGLTDSMDQSMYLDGHRDASREVVQMLTLRMLGPVAGAVAL